MKQLKPIASAKKILISISILSTLVIIAGLVFFLWPMKKGHIILNTSTGSHCFNVKIADTWPLQLRGLMFRKLNPNDGMVFVYEEKKFRTFWMYKTIIPLDLIFISDEQIVEIHLDLEPNTTNTIMSYTTINSALEIMGGRSVDIGLSVGDFAKLGENQICET